MPHISGERERPVNQQPTRNESLGMETVCLPGPVEKETKLESEEASSWQLIEVEWERETVLSRRSVM